jgi:primosomal protein N' (replication factor Y)
MSDTSAHSNSLFGTARYGLFADVIVPIYLPKTLTWGVPNEWADKVQPGCRVEVEVRAKRYAGVVKQLHKQQPLQYETKPILNLLDEQPIVQAAQLQLWQWIASYYCCSEGEVMMAALPSHLKLSSESIVQYNEHHGVQPADLTDREYLVAEALEVKQQLTLKEIQTLLDSHHVYPVVKKLVEKGVATVWENLPEKYKEKTETYVLLAPRYRAEPELAALLNDWGKKAGKQLELLLAYLHFEKTEGQVSKASLLKKSGASASVLDGLVAKQILLLEKRSVDRLPQMAKHIVTDVALSPAQQTALLQLREKMQQHTVTLLHGVTGSGKTQLYIELIAEQVRQGRQVLYLLPEIALTSQIVRKLRHHLGGHVGIYHSKFNPHERLELWNKVLSGEIQVILGARSSLFLPFARLGLIIVDEEHDTSFKQADPPPRYHARDTAIYYAGLCGAKVLLGSATPSLESYHHCQQGKYGLVSLLERYGDLQLPDMELIDLKQLPESRSGKVILSAPMQQRIQQSLEAGRQVIVFQNRRGYTPYQVCNTCGWIPKCHHCDVSLTFHKSTNKLHCHYCGTTYAPAKECGACGSQQFRYKNFGTEQLEEVLDTTFEKAQVARMDTDSVRGKHSHENIIRQFEEQRIQILAGTQMVVKGLDFDNVGLVCIPDADGIFRFADFRATERAFQLIEQVSGRAGRKGEKGKVLLQLMDTQHPLLGYLQRHDYHGFYLDEIKKRRDFHYPPFTRLIVLHCKHRDQLTAWNAGETLAAWLRLRYDGYVTGPAEPPVNRIRNQYITELLLKLPPQAKLLAAAKQYLREGIAELNLQPAFRSVMVQIDVDPQ